MRLEMVKQIKKSVLRMKLNDFIFNNNSSKTKQYLEQLLQSAQIDEEFICIEALSYAMLRPIVVLSSLSKHKLTPILQFNSDIEKPPFVVGAYERNKKIIFLPFPS